MDFLARKALSKLCVFFSAVKIELSYSPSIVSYVICSTIIVAFCSLISLMTLEINSSGLFLNIKNLSVLIPCKMAATVLRVSIAPSATLPIRSYFILLVCACLNVCVLVFSLVNEVNPSISYSFISDF